MKPSLILNGRSEILLATVIFSLLTACVSTENLQRKMASGPPEYPKESLIPRSEIKPDAPPYRAPSEGPLRLSIRDAILSAFENNQALVLEKFNPSIQQTVEDQELAVFDPVLEASVSAGRAKERRLTTAGTQTGDSTTDTFDGAISLSRFFPTGTTVDLEGKTSTTDSSLSPDPFSQSRLGLTVTQALLQGYGTEFNLASLRRAEIDTEISLYELRGFSETLLSEVETAYWDYALAQRQIEIVEESLKVVRQQLAETEEMIAVGTMAESELAAVQAEVAAQEQALIDAKSAAETARLRLLRLINPPGTPLYEREVELLYDPTIPELKLDDVKDHVALSLRMLPLVNQTKLGIQQNDLDIVRTRNGLLPRLDLFISLGKSGYADSFSGSVSDITNENSYDVLAGVNLRYPIFNRDAEAQHRRSILLREQAEEALKNVVQLVELDVRSAYIEVRRSKEQIAASAATRRFQEEKLRTETEKFKVGRSTSILVAQAQRDVLAARISEVEAIVNYLRALINFYRVEGTLLARRGIAAPGNEPVTLYNKSVY
jgi:outer membrane protein TolC